MIRKLAIILLIIIGIHSPGYSQTNTKTTTYVEQVWLAYFNQTRFSNNWGIWVDIQLRTKDDFVEELSTFLARFGGTYYLNDNTKLTLGYAFINHFPADNHQNISQPEHRPWQQIQWHNKYSKLRTMQYFRLEERFRRKILNDDELADGYSFNWRLRYNFFLQVPFNKDGPVPKSLSFVLNDELHINFGEQIVYNYFDQNRFFVGLSYQVNQTDNIQLGYNNVFSQNSSGNQYRMMNGVRVVYLHNLDLRSR